MEQRRAVNARGEFDAFRIGSRLRSTTRPTRVVAYSHETHAPISRGRGLAASRHSHVHARSSIRAGGVSRSAAGPLGRRRSMAACPLTSAFHS